MAKVEKDLTTKEYVLLSGKHWGFDENGEEVGYKKGDLVPLTENQYNAFKDKFEDPEAMAARRVAPRAKAPTKEAATPKTDAKSPAVKQPATPAPASPTQAPTA
jgi:hypothetical protein